MRKFFVLSAISVFLAAKVQADAAGLQCDFGAEQFLPETADIELQAVDIKADDMQYVDKGTSVLTGNVEVVRKGQQLTADKITYHSQTGQITAQGQVGFRDSHVILQSETADWLLFKDEGTMQQAHYRLREKHARGEAGKVFRRGNVLTKLVKATYTTCPPGDNAWRLQASRVRLDHVQGVGQARNVVVRVGGLPVFYSPYMSFPLNDKRKSGFLTPSYGTSDETGFDLITPYYWNISPDKDATLSPRYMSNRGLMLNGEFRYLSPLYSGKVDAAYLASDQLQQLGSIINPYYKQARKHFSWRHQGTIASGWRTKVDYNYISDKDYLEDFAGSLSLTSTTHINRLLDISYTADNWRFSGRLQGYQTLVNVSKPYQRLPQLQFSGLWTEPDMGFRYGLGTEYVDFDHATRIAGLRFNIEPSFSMPLQAAYGFITPKITVQHTQYKLRANGNLLTDSTLSRTLPKASIDSGLVFERNFDFFRTAYTQTLEPRAYYLYVPYRNQTAIPLFDTGLRTFNMTQLFTDNRFSGTDRVGDANQLSLALTSRIIDESNGREKGRVTVGQIRYFSDRRVTLNNTAPDTRSHSDMVAEVVAEITRQWTAHGEIQWDPAGTRNNLSSVTLRYRGHQGQLLNMSHRYRRNSIEQIDISARLPLNRQWHAVGRWYHSIRDRRTLEGLVGIEYDSCCWATRFVVRNFINSIRSQQRNLAFFFQIELKGLGNFGQDIDTLLNKSILGYQH